MLPIIFRAVLFLPSLAPALTDGDAGGEVGTLDRRTLAEITEKHEVEDNHFAFIKVESRAATAASAPTASSTTRSRRRAARPRGAPSARSAAPASTAPGGSTTDMTETLDPGETLERPHTCPCPWPGPGLNERV